MFGQSEREVFYFDSCLRFVVVVGALSLVALNVGLYSNGSIQAFFRVNLIKIILKGTSRDGTFIFI